MNIKNLGRCKTLLSSLKINITLTSTKSIFLSIFCHFLKEKLISPATDKIENFNYKIRNIYIYRKNLPMKYIIKKFPRNNKRWY